MKNGLSGIAGSIALVLLATFALVAVTGWMAIQKLAIAPIEAETDALLRNSYAQYLLVQQQRFKQLQLISRIFSTDASLTQYVLEATTSGNPTSVLDALEEYQNLLDFDLAVVVDANGRVVTSTDRVESPVDPNAEAESLANSPLIAIALDQKQSSGVWQRGNQVLHSAAIPMVQQFNLVGYIAVALRIDNRLAQEMKRISGHDSLFVANSPTGPQVIASTMTRENNTALIDGLRRLGEPLSMVLEKGEPVESLEIDFGGESVAFLAPLVNAAGQPNGATVLVSSVGPTLQRLRTGRLILIAAAAIAAAIAFLLIIGLTGRALAPAAPIAAQLQNATTGHLQTRQVGELKGSGPLIGLARTLNRWIGRIQGQESLRSAVGQVERYLDEPKTATSSPGQEQRASANEQTLLGVELRRFADPRLGYDPDEALGRLGRDLDRIRTVAQGQDGQILAILGHRILVGFAGEQHQVRALGTAAEAQFYLSQRENVFDEPTPPVVALESGPTVDGPVAKQDPPVSATIGQAVQLLESLLREAAPGEILLGRNLFLALAANFQEKGVEVRSQKGVLTPQPILLISAAEAAKTVGLDPESWKVEAGGSGLPGLGDLEEGGALANRFQIASDLGSSSAGRAFKAYDRQDHDWIRLLMIKPELIRDQKRFEQLRQQIQKARNLRHPNVVPVLDFGEANGKPYVAFGFRRANTLRTVVELGKQLPVAATIELMRQAAAGLAAVQETGLIHARLSPDVINIEGSGRVQVDQVGLAAVPASHRETNYRAPEVRLAGWHRNSDQFSFGFLIYEAITGSPPDAKEPADFELIAPPSSESGCSEQLDRIILRCLHPDPDQRFGGFSEIVQQLQDA